MLVVNGGQNGQLLDDNEDRSTNRNENLTHDLVSDTLTRVTEVDHQPLGKDVERNGDIQEPLEATGLTNGCSDAEQQDTGNHVEGVDNVSGFSNSQIVHDLQEVLEVVVPAVVRKLVGRIQETGADNSAVGEETPIEKRDWGDPLLVETEEEQHGESDHDHGDDVVSTPAVRGLGGDIEWKLEKDQTSSENEHSEY